MNVPFLWEKMLDASRNIGSRGIAASAIAAVDIALWDLKAKILKVPLCILWGQVRESVPVYGSGGFTSYSSTQLAKQFEDWKSKGIDKFKLFPLEDHFQESMEMDSLERPYFQLCLAMN